MRIEPTQEPVINFAGGRIIKGSGQLVGIIIIRKKTLLIGFWELRFRAQVRGDQEMNKAERICNMHDEKAEQCVCEGITNENRYDQKNEQVCYLPGEE